MRHEQRGGRETQTALTTDACRPSMFIKAEPGGSSARSNRHVGFIRLHILLMLHLFEFRDVQCVRWTFSNQAACVCQRSSCRKTLNFNWFKVQGIPIVPKGQFVVQPAFTADINTKTTKDHIILNHWKAKGSRDKWVLDSISLHLGRMYLRPDWSDTNSL